MPAISTKKFTGIRPSVSPNLLPDGAAQLAVDCDLSGGSLRPFNANSVVFTPPTPNEVKTIYNYVDKFGVKKWLYFEGVVNVERGLVANDDGARIYYTGDGEPRVTDTDKLNEPTNYYKLGVPAPASAPTTNVNTVGTTPTERAYVTTFVTSWGEESAPSPASQILSAGTGSSVTVAIPVSANDQGYNPVTKVYLYRTVQGNTAADWQFVAEIPHGTTSYIDTINDADLDGDLLVTEHYALPPVDLAGLKAMDNGCMVGFSKNEICLSESYQPHAYPFGYRYASKDNIVGIGVYGNRIVVLTDRSPFMLYGNDPASMSPTNISSIAPCVSARGICSTSDGVIYPAPDGLWFVGSGGVRNLTKGFYSPVDWAGLNPSEFVAEVWDDKYVAFTSNGGFLFDLRNPDNHVKLTVTATAVHVDSGTKSLFLNTYIDSQNNIKEFASSDEALVTRYQSKEYFNADAIAFSCGRVYSNYFGLTAVEAVERIENYHASVAYNQSIFLAGNDNDGINSRYINQTEINGSDFISLPSLPPDNVVNVKFYADHALVFEGSVSDREVFRMPIGYRANVFSYEIESPMDVAVVQFATSARELIG